MSLQDHFGPPLGVRRHWHAFHNAWATYISADLNRRLPAGYFAEANVQFGIEIDVAAFEGNGTIEGAVETNPSWTPPAPTKTVPMSVLTDIVEVQVFHREGGPILAGAVELVSPANKDRPAHRDAFTTKCAAYLQQGVGLILVDVVTERGGNLHTDLLARVSSPGDALKESDLYAAAYRPVVREGQTSLDYWYETLVVGSSLPTLPLWLRGTTYLSVDLNASYDRTCQEQRILSNGA
jgi:hypothetical protein